MPRQTSGMNAPRRAIATKVAALVARDKRTISRSESPKYVAKKACLMMPKEQPVVSIYAPVTWNYLNSTGEVKLYKGKNWVTFINQELGNFIANQTDDDCWVSRSEFGTHRITICHEKTQGSFPFKIQGVIFDILFEELEHAPSPGMRTPPKVTRQYLPLWKSEDAEQHMPPRFEKREEELYNWGEELFWVNKARVIKHIIVVNPGDDYSSNFIFREIVSGTTHHVNWANICNWIFRTEEVSRIVYSLSFGS